MRKHFTHPTGRTFATAALVALAVALVALTLGASGAQAASSEEQVDAAPSQFALQVVALINQERVSRGLAPLGTDVRLFNASEGHTAWMIAHNTFSHRGEGGSTPADRALAAGYRYTALGESLARGHTSPEMVVRGRTCDRYCITSCDSSRRCDGWKQSPAHWRILMGSHYRDIGAAYMRGYSSRPHWWTVMVGNSNSPAVPLGSSPPPPTATDVRPTATQRVPTATSVRPTATTWRPTATRVPTRTPRPKPTATRVPKPTATTASGTGSISGCVQYDDSGPLSGVTIKVDGRFAGRTGPDGCFVVSGVASGRRKVEAHTDGALNSRKTIQVGIGVRSNLGSTRLVGGDAYVDNKIDLLDLLTVAAARGKCVGRSGYSLALDVDHDGCVGDSDFNIVWGRVGRSGPTGWTLNP